MCLSMLLSFKRGYSFAREKFQWKMYCKLYIVCGLFRKNTAFLVDKAKIASLDFTFIIWVNRPIKPHN